MRSLWSRAPKIVSTDHAVKKETGNRMWGATIPWTRKNSPTKLVVHRFKIVSHVVWPIGNSFTINTQFITHLVNQTSLFHILIPLSLCLYLYFFIHFLVWLKNQNSCTKHSIGEVRKPTTEEQSSHHTVSLESKRIKIKKT